MAYGNGWKAWVDGILGGARQRLASHLARYQKLCSSRSTSAQTLSARRCINRDSVVARLRNSVESWLRFAPRPSSWSETTSPPGELRMLVVSSAARRCSMLQAKQAGALHHVDAMVAPGPCSLAVGRQGCQN